ncbi:hypothetical protein, partial [Streptomyces griseoaurantiacus]|uniref:hypothetical protein n=1 Tax=Streptomyces griseoaurantiacus TaxID=68213 RepID=UPI00296F906B
MLGGTVREDPGPGEGAPPPGLSEEPDDEEEVSSFFEPRMSSGPTVLTFGGFLKLNLPPSHEAPWPRWRSLTELRPPPRKVVRPSVGKWKMAAVASSPSASAPPSVRKC